MIRGSTSFRSLPEEYRGTNRGFPYHVDECDPAKQAYSLYSDAEDEDGFLHDINIARKVVKAYETLMPPELYEIIEVTEGKETPESLENIFLGYDLSCLGESLVASLITLNRESDDRPWEVGVSRPAILFDRLIVDHFKPKLNKYLLFDSYEAAEYCLECMTAVLELAPQFYEPVGYRVVGIYKII